MLSKMFLGFAVLQITYPNFLISSIYLLISVVSFTMNWSHVIMMMVMLEFVVLVMIYYVLHSISKTSIMFFIVSILVMESVMGVSLLVVFSRATSKISSSSFIW